MTPTIEEKNALITLAENESPEIAIERCIQMCQDKLASQLFERGGFGTLQLNPNPHAIPRMQFVEPDKTQVVNSVKIDGVRLVRN